MVSHQDLYYIRIWITHKEKWHNCVVLGASASGSPRPQNRREDGRPNINWWETQMEWNTDSPPQPLLLLLLFRSAMPMALSSSASFLRNPSNILPSSGSGSGLSSKFHGTISPRPLLLPPPHPLHHRSSSSSSSTCFAQVFHPAAAELEAQAPGGKMVAELVGAFNNLTQRMGMLALSTTSSHLLLFNSLKLSIPLLYPRPPSDPNDVRSPLTRALSVACLLADLQVLLNYLLFMLSLEIWQFELFIHVTWLLLDQYELQ